MQIRLIKNTFFVSQLNKNSNKNSKMKNRNTFSTNIPNDFFCVAQQNLAVRL